MYSPATIHALNQAAHALVKDMDRYVDRLYPNDAPPNKDISILAGTFNEFTAVMTDMANTCSPDDHRTLALVRCMATLMQLYEVSTTAHPAPHIKPG